MPEFVKKQQHQAEMILEDIEADAEEQITLPDETKAEKFERLARKRFPKAVKSLRLLKNLSNKSAYEYDPVKIDAMLTLIRAEVDSIEQAFSNSTGEDGIPNPFGDDNG